MTIKVATIGTGFFSQYHYDSWSRIPGASLAAICTRSNQDKLKQIAEQYGVQHTYLDAERMLDEIKPDLIDIITTPETHQHFVSMAAERGIATICQKPLAPTLDGAKLIVETAERHNTLLVAHENWRFKPWFREAKRLLDEGRIGAPYSVAFSMRPGDGQGKEAYMDRQPYFQQMPRFWVHETGIHMVDVFRYLMGEVSGVFARLKKRNPHIAGEDSGYVLFDYAAGSTGLLDGNRLADFPAENSRLTMGTMLIDGEQGSIRLDGEGNLWTRSRGQKESLHSYKWENRGYSGDCVHALQTHVIRHLQNGSAIENIGRQYLRNLEIEDAIYRSNEERRWIAL